MAHSSKVTVPVSRKTYRRMVAAAKRLGTTPDTLAEVALIQAYVVATMKRLGVDATITLSRLP